MLRLLEEEDIRFLRAQPGFTQRIERDLRLQRCAIFRGYLRCLRDDYARVCEGVRELLFQSRRDRPDLCWILLRSRVRFAFGMMAVRVRLALYARGLGSVRADELVGLFDSVRLELCLLAPLAEPES